MRRRPYPLEVLARVRAERVEQAGRALGTATATRAQAERALEGAQQARLEHDARVSSVEGAERHALDRGDLRAADLAVSGAWRARADVERRALEEAQRAATGRLVEASSVEAAARAETASRQADARVVEQDRARFDAAARRRQELDEEEAAAEAFRGPR